MISENRHHQLPLFGNFCCRLAAQPDCATQERIAGFAIVPVSKDFFSIVKNNFFNVE